MNDRPDLHSLTGAYAVDALPDDERELFEDHLDVCEPCAQEVREFQATAARLGAAAVAAPPDAMRGRVLAAIDTVRQERPSPTVADDVVELRRRVPRWVATSLGVAASVLLIALGGLAVVVDGLRDQVASLETAAATAEAATAEVEVLQQRLVELESQAAESELRLATTSTVTDVLAAPDVVTVAVDDAAGFGRVVASPTRGEAVFVAEGWDAAPHEHTYELWLITEDGATPAGLFDPDESGRATRVMTGDVAGAVAVGVTVEPEGGSPEPTTEPMMVLELS